MPDVSLQFDPMKIAEQVYSKVRITPMPQWGELKPWVRDNFARFTVEVISQAFAIAREQGLNAFVIPPGPKQ